MTKTMPRLLLAWVVLCVCAGCHPAVKARPEGPAAKPVIAAGSFCVMPFLKGKYALQAEAPPDLTLTCPVAGLCVTQENFPVQADRVMTRLAWQKTADRFGDAVVPLNESRLAYTGMTQDPAADTLLSLARRLGAALNVDYVVAGTVWRFREREGYAASASRPASVAFAVYLVDVRQGTGIWSAAFD
ncbi:MAG: hypothetical protein ACOZBW_02005, partial [Thermodesulfobacteriota bacterium]